MKDEIYKARAKDDFLLYIMTLWIWQGNTHYNHPLDKQQHKEWRCLTNGRVVQRVFIQLRHHVYIKFDPVSLGSSIFISMAFLAYMSFWGLHQCLKAQLIAAFIQDIFKLIRLAIFGYNIYLTIAFGTFSYTLQGVF